MKKFIQEFKFLQMMKKTRQPRWNEEFQFMLEEPPLHEKIHIEVISKRKNFSFLSKVTFHFSLKYNLLVISSERIRRSAHLLLVLPISIFTNKINIKKTL
jgi:hypothetical protein